MKVAILGDTHFGYYRFEEDGYRQGEEALLKASEMADIIIHTGDMFDARVPRLEVIKRTIDILKKVKKPMVAIHGNHERRTKDQVNILKIFDSMGLLKYLHNETVLFENVSILGIGSIPEDMAAVAIHKSASLNMEKMKGFRILAIHQTLADLGYGGYDLDFDFIEKLPFDLVVDGHIHKAGVFLNGKLVVPGSTVITQLREDESDKRGFYIYDTETRKAEFVEISSRPFFIEKIEFNGEGMEEARKRIIEVFERIKKQSHNAIVKIKLTGALKEGLRPSDFSFDSMADLFVQNDMKERTLGERIREIQEIRQEKMSVRERILSEITKQLDGKISFSPSEMFELLSDDPEKAYEKIIKEART
ncbi:MAG: metallophosphoesterase family protein [Candidatus Anstonellales archaeon]